MEKYIQNITSLLLKRSEVLKRHLDLTIIVEDEKWNKRFVSSGMLDCLPIAQMDKLHAIALRADPKTTNPAVVVTHFIHGESMLVCPNISSFVPIWIVTKLIIVPSSYWELWEAKNDDDWNSIIELHKSLGGTDELNDLKSFIKNKRFKQAFCNDLDGELWRNVLPEAYSNAVPYSSRGKFQHMIKEVRKNGWVGGINTEDFYEWEQPLLIVLGVIGNPPSDQLLLEILERACYVPNNHDANWSFLDGVLEYSGCAAKDFGAPILISKALIQRVPNDWKNKLDPAIRNLAEKEEKYDGKEHLDLLENLYKSENFTEAWNTGLSFCFWRYQKHKDIGSEAKYLMGKLALDFFPETLWPIVSRNLNTVGGNIKS